MIDARALTVPSLSLDFGAATIDTRAVQTLDLAPGVHSLAQAEGGDPVSFSVAPDGTVAYDPSLDGILGGRSTSTLDVNGRTITVDATALSLSYLVLGSDNTDYFRTAASFRVTVLPGHQYLAGYDASGGGSVSFSVADDGTLDYSSDPSLQGVLDGRGGRTLTVNGRTVTINATALSLSYLVLGSDNTDYFRTAASFQVTVLPGRPYLAGASGGGGIVYFSVANDGTVDSSNPLALSDALEGRGTTALTIRGETIHIDARALSGVSPTFTVPGVGTFDATAVQTLTLLPGWEQFQAGSVTLDFEAELFNTVEYDPFLDSTVASGRGTDTLVLLPPR
jgi:hypothetical protein